VPLVLVSATYAILAVLPSRYQSTVQILMLDPQGPNITIRGQHSEPVRNLDTVSVNTETAVMKSATSLQRVVRDLTLDENPEFQRQKSRSTRLLELLGEPHNVWLTGVLQKLFGDDGEGSLDESHDHTNQRVETAVNILGQHIQVQPIPLTYVLAVSATSGDPRLAQRIASSLVDHYLAAEQEARNNGLDQVATWLTDRIAELKTQVADTETAIEKLKATSGLSDTGKGSVVQQQIADLNAQLMIARADVAEKRARWEQAQQVPSGYSELPDAPDTPASPLITQLRLQQSLVTRHLAQLRAKLGDSHSEVLAVAAQLAGINKAISDEAAHLLIELKNKYDIAARREQEIQSSFDRMTAAQANSGDAVKLGQLQQAAEGARKLYDSYLAQYNEIEATKSLSSVNERIISPALVPTDPVFPRRSLFLLGAGAIGLFLGFAAAFIANYFKAGAALGAEAERTFGHPVIGNLPLINQRRPHLFRRDYDPDRSVAKVVLGEPFSPVSEAVRSIRIGMRLSNLASGPQVILVTSSVAGEGKSTLAALLAASSAAAGQRTVLVDCDVRKRSISRRFHQEQPGLTDLLSGSTNLAAVTVSDSDIGCHVIPAGAMTQSPGDLLASARMVGTIEWLRTQYDYIVVDSPPLLAVVDALALATIADKIVVTVDGSYAHDVSVAEAFRLLRPEAHRIAGIVFNKVAPEQMQRYGYYGYPRRA
jgi:capsular exopolysaccharide synthesis family protein